MVIMNFSLGLMLVLFFYFKHVLTSFNTSTSFVFFYRNLLKHNSKLNCVFISKKCNSQHPHLRPFAISFLIQLVVLLLLFATLILSFCIKEINLQRIIHIISVVLATLVATVVIGTLIYCEILNNKADKELDNLPIEEINKMRCEIEKEWPDFFK